jgi:uncharacterized membrane protein
MCVTPQPSGEAVVGKQPSERRRVITACAIGVLVGSAVAWLGPWQLALLSGWDFGSGLLVGWIWISVAKLDATATKLLATREDDSRAASRGVVVVACVASLIGVFAGILKAREVGGGAGAVLTVGSVIAVVFAWSAVHTIFMLRYAHNYYDRDGGIVFPNDDEPSYLDFAYVAFTVGMTFQVSDTDISNRSMRALLLKHAALSYLFGTVIVGLTINVLGGLLG